MSALRIGIALSAVLVAACDNFVGLHDITPDGEPVALVFTPDPASSGMAKQPLGSIIVSALDITGRPARDFRGEVKLALGNNPGGATLLGTLTTTANAGTALFDLVGIDRPGTGYTLVASTEGFATTSAPIDIVTPRFTPVPSGLAGGPIASIAISPAPTGGTTTMFAGGGHGVYQSVDGGTSWKAGFNGDAAAQLVADPSRPGVAYSVSRSYVVKKTTDAGVTWHELGVPAHPSGFAVDPKDPSVLYANRQPLRRSIDGGTTWRTLSAPAECIQLVVDPVTTNTLYCALSGPNTDVYKSSNRGETWAPVHMLGSSPGGAILMLTATPRGVFVAVLGMLYRSIDGGASWTGVLPSNTFAVAYAPSMPDRIYRAGDGGLAVSNDGGASFAEPVFIDDIGIGSLAVDPANPDVVYAGGARGVFVSTNGGASWSLSSKGIDAHWIVSLAMSPGAPSTLLTMIDGTVRRTTDGGTSWTTVYQLSSARDLGVVGFDPAVSTRAYVCGFSTFATSINSGASFSGGNVAAITSSCHRLLVAGSKLFIAGAQLFKSTDRGANWTYTGLGDPRTNFFVYDTKLGDAAGNVVVAATSSGVYRSTNGGTSFTQVNTDPGSILAVDPSVPSHLVLGTCNGFRISTDGGASFGGTSSGLCVRDIIAAGSALYAGGTDSDKTVLLTSTDGGSSWAPIDITGVPAGASVTSIAVSDDGKTVYLGTNGGLYKGPGR